MLLCFKSGIYNIKFIINMIDKGKGESIKENPAIDKNNIAKTKTITKNRHIWEITL